MNVAELGVKVSEDGVVTTDRKLDSFTKTTDRADTGVRKFTKSTKRMNATLAGTVGKLGAFAAAYVSIAGARQAIMSARDFSGALAEVSTLIEGTTAQMADLEAQSMRLASTFGGSATSQAKAYYQAISAGASAGADATKLLTAANKLAIGGVTDVSTGVDVLTTAMNVYKKSGLSATEASDALFVGMRAGKTTIGELSAGIGKLLPLGSALGLTFDELVAGTSALTKGGISTAESITGMRATLAAITGPSKQAADLAKELGIEFSAAGLAATKGGLNAFMADIVKKTGGSTAAMQKLFGGVEATGVALAFAGQSGQFYGEILDDMKDKAGTTQTAFEKMAGALDQRLNVQLGKFGNAVLMIGGALLAVAVPAMEAMTATVMFLADNMDFMGAVLVTIAATMIPSLVTGLVALAAGITATGGVAAIATGALTLFGTAVALAGGPLTVIVALLAGAASYFLIFKKSSGEAEGSTMNFNTQLETNATKLLTAASATKAYREELMALIKVQASSAFSEASRIGSKLDVQIEALDAAGRLIGPNQAFVASNLKIIEAERDKTLSDYKAAVAVNNSFIDQVKQLEGISGSSGDGVTISAVSLPQVDIPALGGGGGAAGIENDFAARMEALMLGLQTEREAVEIWKSEALTTLMEARDLENITQGEHNEYKLRVEQEYQDRLAGIKSAGIAGSLGETSKMFGDWNKLAGGGHEKLLKAEKAFAAAEMLINTYRAAAKVLAEEKGGFLKRIAAAGSVIAAGMGFISAIKGGSSSGGGGGSASGASGTSATAPAATQSAPQRVLLDFQGQGMISVEMLDEIISGIQEASKNGVIIEVAR